MAKDPAVLFYTSDFLSGTMTMTDEQVGKYIRLLCLQHQKGFLTEKDMNYICRTYDEDVYSKFVNEDGKFYNARMRDEAEKRKKYSESRKKNISKRYDSTCEPTHVDTHVEHMENENEDTNTNVIALKTVESEFEVIWNIYPRKEGKKEALRHFKASVKTKDDLSNIRSALENYKTSLKNKNTEPQFIQQGQRWFNNWKDWVSPDEIMMKGNNNAGTFKGHRQSDQTARATYSKPPEQVEQDVRNTTESIRLLYEQRGKRA
jgi:hypothetical protein